MIIIKKIIKKIDKIQIQKHKFSQLLNNITCFRIQKFFNNLSNKMIKFKEKKHKIYLSKFL